MKKVIDTLKAIVRFAWMGLCVSAVFTAAVFVIVFGILCGVRLASITAEWLIR